MITACGGGSSSSSESYDIVSEVVRGSDTQSIQFSQSQVLHPYGALATAEKVTLNLQIYTSQKNIDGRKEDIHKAISEITALVDENESISLAEISVNQVSGSYAKEENSTRNIQNLDTSRIELKLTINLSRYDYNFAKCIDEFNDFLNEINLPSTIKVQALSVEAELGDLEEYRSQIIAQVYQELNVIQNEYGEDVKFEITGLYEPLKKMQINDIEYYLYLEPIVTVIEF